MATPASVVHKETPTALILQFARNNLLGSLLLELTFGPVINTHGL
tara:strand:- start:72053 stop:72187 length:135 start_codon:yes stop_codon:yes gene_type:complete